MFKLTRPVHLPNSSSELVISSIKQIGRGAAGSRNLTREQSFHLFTAILNDQLGDLELGAILMALRVKGESLAEVQGAMDAVGVYQTKQSLHIDTDKQFPVVILPSYNGARSLPNTTALLACLLADAGVQVVVHGKAFDARTSTESVFRSLGIPIVGRLHEVRDCFSRSVPAFIPIEVLNPALAKLLAFRERMGVRNIAHSLVKIFNPSKRPDAIRLVAYTHPEFHLLQQDYFLNSGESAFVMRATEGECVANIRRPQQIDLISAGALTMAVPAQTSSAAVMPVMPSAQDVCATARWTQSMLAGETVLPAAIADQVKAILGACFEV